MGQRDWLGVETRDEAGHIMYQEGAGYNPNGAPYGGNSFTTFTPNNNGGNAYTPVDFSGLVDTPMGQVASKIGLDLFKGGSQNAAFQYQKNMSMLKYYFNVNNSYVINKIKLLLFPIAHKQWARRIHRQNDSEVFLPARDDINAPDLYIPLMAFVTYILIFGYIMGASKQFTPEVLGKMASAGLFVLISEFSFIKLSLYLLNAYTVPFLDIVSFCSYKYVGVVLTMLVGLIFGQYPFYAVLIFTSICGAIFMVKTLKLVFPDMSMGGPKHKRNYFLMGVAVNQLILCYYLSYGAWSASSLSLPAPSQ
ncbi:hypothetical protein PROFUN_11551 [Planoprotostelium fungivorum]|uniref:Protein YIF1 n=1 Tax=Planoprotostelium fungivorum TaxID=1890364 RepID=A0A2P6N9G7_9EUKA|nr:hypothetical protein PROFUN_11551 [Planoprotostelium fungivorum]